MKLFFACVLSWVAYSSVLAQQYSLKNYKAIDGLPQSQVNMVVEDAQGYLWIATHGGGLARFDGSEFKVYTTLDGLSSNIISFLKIDSKQNLWIVHPRGITKFDGRTFKVFEQSGRPVTHKRIRRIFQQGDSLFFLSSPGTLGKIFNDSVYYWSKPVKANKNIAYSHLLPSKETMLYLNDSSFVILGKEGKRSFHHNSSFNRLYSIFTMNQDTWLFTDSGYFTLDTEELTFTKKDLQIKNNILFYDSNKNVFWTRYKNLLLKETLAPGKHEIDTIVVQGSIVQILPDSEGNTWLATNGNGLYKYFIQDFNKCSSENMQSVMAILKEKDGTIWIGTANQGLIRMKGSKVDYFTDVKELYRNSVTCIKQAPDGKVWVGTQYGLGQYQQSTNSFQWFTSNEGLSGSSVTSIQFDEKGNVWVGTFGAGLSFFDGKKFKHYSIKEGLSSSSVLSLYNSKYYQTLFIGGEFGISALKNGSIDHPIIQEIGNTNINSINPFRDSLLLIGTGGSGVVLYNPKTQFKKRISSKEGLSSDFIYFVAADPSDDIWIGTEKGISRIKLDEHLQIESTLQYDHTNGLEGIEANHNAFHLGSDERYFGMIDGLYEFYDLQRKNAKSFPLHLTEVSLSYGKRGIQSYSKGETGFFKIPTDLSLPPDENNITFAFNRVDKRYPTSVKFKYRLVNHDKSWSLPASTYEANYSNLPPGQYTFEVISTNNKGSWDATPLQYSFIVETPFYQTTGFLFTLALLLIGMTLLYFYLRVRYKVQRAIELEQIRSREQEVLRKDIARDFHDEMGNQLSRIINYVSLLRLNGASGMSQQDLYAKVEGSAKYLYTGTRDFIWSIDPVNDELSKLFIHLRDFGEKLFEEKSINFRAYNEVREKVVLPYGFSRQANLIFKEAMTNAFKYSEAQNVKLTLVRNNNVFFMAFEDDGKGFSIGAIENTNGLQNIRDRANRINSVLRISSTPEDLSQDRKGVTIISLEFNNIKSIKYGVTV
jgi:ligand-binding sensor domain-containing protein/signal transduction histidine kinase